MDEQENTSEPTVMSPGRWQRVKEIFRSAIEVPPNQLSGFLAAACGDDQELRNEINSLIEAHHRDGSFIDSPALKDAAQLFESIEQLNEGDVVGHYEILSLLGKGGMGEVYLARDVNLGRRVALKFLSPEFKRSSERVNRFEQEARSASALNHPNILTIHEIGEVDGRRFIATEFIEGENLRTRLRNGALSVIDALNIGEQIASALSAAHDNGIVHRDIKPENIMVRPDGYVKVLDFGLAKLTDRTSSPDEPTLALVKTATGVIMGTTPFMSPEQTRGLQTDARTDLWSLGAVLYEMVTGKAAFSGATPSDVVASVLEREPPAISEVIDSAPLELQRIIKKALRKNRDERYQGAKELQSDLKALRHDLTSGSATTSSDSKVVKESDLRKFAIAAIPVMLLLGVVVFLVYKFAGSKVVPPIERVEVSATTQLTTWPGLDLEPSISPDGNSVAYSSDHLGNIEIFVQSLTPGARELQLTSDGQQNFQPAWSPDGKFIAFHSKNRGGIFVLPASGGASRQIAESGSHPIWSPDGASILFQSEEINDLNASSLEAPLSPSVLRIVPSAGGEVKSLTEVGLPPGGHGDASFSPDGKRIVFVANDGATSALWNMSSTGGDIHEVLRLQHWIYSPIYAPDGEHIYYGGISESGAFILYRLAVSKTDGTGIGEPDAVMNGGLGRIKNLSISANGKRVVYSAPTMRGNISSVSLSIPSMTPIGGPGKLTNDTSMRKGLARFSPNGEKIAFVEFRGGTNQDIWMIDADGKNQVQLTADPSVDWAPSWLPDNEQVAFQSNRGGKAGIWSVSIRTGKEGLLVDPDQNIGWPSISPDGREFVFNSNKSGTTNLWLIPNGTGTARQLTFDNEMMGFACWSRDGKFLAFEMKRGESQFVTVMPVAGGPPTQLTTERGLSWPYSWSPDDDKIAFAGYRNDLWNIYWISRSTKEQKQLTHYNKLNAFVRYPEWDPSGKRIIYEYSESVGNIWLMDLK
ncbi:MAG TPA: protein kinase [Pyrinomonadaceae bacterium]|nr:protein kinase [Pyrinomonadaceae bacterium]